MCTFVLEFHLQHKCRCIQFMTDFGSRARRTSAAGATAGISSPFEVTDALINCGTQRAVSLYAGVVGIVFPGESIAPRCQDILIAMARSASTTGSVLIFRSYDSRTTDGNHPTSTSNRAAKNIFLMSLGPDLVFSPNTGIFSYHYHQCCQ
jgi:hypothetical protein